MRDVSDDITDAWRNEAKIGDSAAVFRATVEKAHMSLYPYNTADDPGGDYGTERDRRGNFGTFLFSGANNPPPIRTIRNIVSYEATLGTDTDAEEATLVILNTDITPIGNETEDSEDFDDPGRFTFSRGNPHVEANRWDHGDTGWDEVLAPDRLVRVYAGYGVDDSISPALDPHLTIRGTWMIDTVQISTDGKITIKMRNLARLLLDHISFPPVIPWEDYPLTWSTIANVDVPGRAPTGGAFVRPHGLVASSNEAYVIHHPGDDPDWEPALDDSPRYVGKFGGVQGHNVGDPLNGDVTQYWLSTGQDDRRSFVWWEFDWQTNHNVSAIKLRTLSGPYKVFISVRASGEWQGKRKIPYTPSTGDIDNGARIRFVHQEIVNKGDLTEIVLPRVYHGDRIRLTFTRLRNLDGNYPWRAGLRDFQVYTGTGLGFDTTGTVTKPVGNYRDWTDVVKWVCAWAGFWRPDHPHNIIRWSGDTDESVHYDYVAPDPVLTKGKVWGNFQNTGTAGIADATPDNFDKQPLMDVVNYVRNIVGFFFRVDEVGMVAWRMPNLYAKGNYKTPNHLQPGRELTYVDEHLTIDETDVLVEYDTTLDSKNLRERIFVANSNGKVGTVIRGYYPYWTGLRRVAGWTDEHFKSNRECRVAADMVAAQQMFSWRTATVTMPAHPGIQPDDQIRIFERVSNETFYHYVLGIDESWDSSTGVWTMQLTTHWLGERPSDAWVVRVDQLDAATQAYLSHLGVVD